VAIRSTSKDGTPKPLYFSTIAEPQNDSDDCDEEQIRRELNLEDERMFTLLIQYKECHGDCHVPSGNGKFSVQERDRLEVSRELASWVSKQRVNYRVAQGRKGKLPRPLQIKILLLEAMGFMWSDREAQVSLLLF
jgi:hypothetical protein